MYAGVAAAGGHVWRPYFESGAGARHIQTARDN